MARLPQPCPFSDECHGTIELHPEIETKFVVVSSDSIRYLTQVTINCVLVAQCSCCTFCEVAANDAKDFTFEQINNTIPTTLKRYFPVELEKMIQHRKEV